MPKPPPYVEVEFKGFRRDIFSNPQEYPLKEGAYVILQVEKGEDVGTIRHAEAMPCHHGGKPVFEVLRQAKQEEIDRLKENRRLEGHALIDCRARVKKHNLDMKVVDAEYQLDHNRLTFYFVADQRIDFRELVRDLASVYRTRIELRQIGARDEARRVGGIGMCGITMCCITCIRDFRPISTQYAKEQGLSMNPAKLSGICGRLKCCLAYEKDQYLEALAKFPDVDSEILTGKGMGSIYKIDIFRELVYVKYPNEDWDTLTLEETRNCQKASHSEN